jgi:hypothetical protein
MKIRPHHVRFIQNFEQTLQTLRNPLSSLASYAASQHLLILTRIYGEEMVPNLTRLVSYLKNNPHEKVQLVTGRDEICDLCPYQDSCLNGNYSPIGQAHQKAGCNYQGDPKTSDKSALELIKREKSIDNLEVRDIFQIHLQE